MKGILICGGSKIERLGDYIPLVLLRDSTGTEQPSSKDSSKTYVSHVSPMRGFSAVYVGTGMYLSHFYSNKTHLFKL